MVYCDMSSHGLLVHGVCTLIYRKKKRTLLFIPISKHSTLNVERKSLEKSFPRSNLSRFNAKVSQWDEIISEGEFMFSYTENFFNFVV